VQVVETHRASESLQQFDVFPGAIRRTVKMSEKINDGVGYCAVITAQLDRGSVFGVPVVETRDSVAGYFNAWNVCECVHPFGAVFVVHG
jgi:hypothetical protein|tara:strand:- start:622 stop:888 length:267 start_codon:yes stop_codon:yes gene_type:complete